MTGLTRRRLMQSALGVASASAVGAFANGRAQAQGAFDWQKYKGSKLEVLLQRGPYQDVLQKFEPEFTALTGIQIGSEQIPEQQYRQKLAIEFASGKPSFDACYVAHATQTRLFGKGKWLSDLKPLIADTSMTPADFDFADFTKASIQACTQPDGRVDTLPLTFHYNMLMYNKELLDKKGVRPPTTFEELAEAAQKLNDQANGISGFVARGLKNANTPVWTSFMLGHGIDPVTSDGKLQTDGPEAVAAAQLYQKLVRDCGPPGVAGFNWYECQAMFMQGRAAMWIDTSTVGATAADPTKSKIADKVGFIAMPKGPKVHRAPVFPSGMAVAAGSAKQGPAWYYVQWATGKANQARQLAGGYGAGGRQSANEAAKSSSEAKLSREWLDVVIQSGDLAYPVLPDIVAANEFRDVFGVALTNLLSPGADAAKELKTATETFKPILERTEKT